MPDFLLRAMTDADRDAVASLIFQSINAWYQAAGKGPRFPAGPTSTCLFPDVYEAIDPGCCIVAEDPATHRLAGSCFYHPRPTHISLGIMNALPDYFGQGVARKLLRFITDLADAKKLPLRLVSSAMNLDSFSLYTQAGFVPRAVFHDMVLEAPPQGLAVPVPQESTVRDARLDDVPAMAALELELCHIRRDSDFRYFIENREGIWHMSVIENRAGEIDGFLVSVHHPASHMLGPGVMRTDDDALALIAAELNYHRGRKPVFIVPADRPNLVRSLYGLGAKNIEIHLCQVRGEFKGFSGVAMPTFMPETG